MNPEPPRTTAKSLKVEDLVDDVIRGRVRIPAFQRKLRWKRADNLKLIDSVLRGYPIGALLFWEREAPAGRVQLGSIELDVPSFQSAWFIVDGQQRIVALLEALAPPSPQRAHGDFWIDLENEEVRATPTATAVPTNQLGDNERLLAWSDSSPLRVSRPDLIKRAYGISKRIREYELPAYIVQAGEGDVADIFDRLNTSGRSLTRPEIFRAIEHATSSEPGRLDGLRRQIESLAFGGVRDETILQAVQGVAGHDVNKPPPRSWAKAHQATAFADAARGLTAAIVFLKTDVGIPHSALLPYSLPLVVLARVFHLFPALSHRNRVLLARWFWRATLHGALRGDNVPLVGRFISAVQAGDEDRSVQELLHTVAADPPIPPLQPQLNLHGAASKLEVLALLQFRPRHLDTLQELDVAHLLGEVPLSKLLQPLTSVRKAGPWGRSIANRIVHPFVGKESLPKVTWPAAVVSHALAVEDLDVESSGLIERRAKRIHERMSEWLGDVAGLKQSDRPALSRLLAGEAA